MLTSLAFIFLLGLLLGYLSLRVKLPALIGMLMAGVLLGPHVGNLLSDTLLGVSLDLRQLALVIILSRAGLSLNIAELKRVGRPAILMCFVPACFELGGMLLLAPLLFGVSLLDAAIMGTVVAAVSPAVIVPKMLTLMENNYGVRKSIPQMIMAGGSVDDVFIIVLFTAFTGLAMGKDVSPLSFLQIPVSIVSGLVLGVLLGLFFKWFFATHRRRDSVKVLILMSSSFLLIALEHALADVFPLSGLLAVMSTGGTLLVTSPLVAKRLSERFGKLWVGAEILLFVLVGATVDVNYVLAAGGMSLLLICGTLLFRMLGVYVSLLGTSLLQKERLFCMIAYMPKATVQAAIGSLPLSMGLSCGHLVLTVAVLSILVTAPVGDFLIEYSYKRLLEKDSE